jgi:signal peptidase II
MRKKSKSNPYIKVIVFIVLLVILDQVTKYLIRNNFDVNESVPIISNIIHITYVQNTGVSFGMLKGFNQYFIWISLIVLGIILYNYDAMPHVVLVLILTGIIGNAIDRIALGYVVDFIDFRIWPIFNVADSCISLGVLSFIIDSFKTRNK